jgi:hypothetical protein
MLSRLRAGTGAPGFALRRVHLVVSSGLRTNCVLRNGELAGTGVHVEQVARAAMLKVTGLARSGSGLPADAVREDRYAEQVRVAIVVCVGANVNSTTYIPWVRRKSSCASMRIGLCAFGESRFARLG